MCSAALRVLLLIGMVAGWNAAVAAEAPAPASLKVACDGVRDATGALQGAVDEAARRYGGSGAVVVVSVAGTCVVGTGAGNVPVRIGSGVVVKGPARVRVPRQTAGVFVFRNANHSGIDSLTIEVGENVGPSSPLVCGICWLQSGDTRVSYSDFSVTNNTVSHANWGIVIFYNDGRFEGGRLTGVRIVGNTVTSPLVGGTYSDFDGIHVAGAVSGIDIEDNHVSNRGDAGIALTSEAGGFVLSGAVVKNNELSEDRVGLDNSGATDVEYVGNHVSADIATGTSNPAFRSIPYPRGSPITPKNITVQGNYLVNYAGTEFAAKVDDAPADEPTNVTFSGNTLGSLYLRGRGLVVTGNTFVAGTGKGPGGTLVIDYDGPHSVATADVVIGKNTWQGDVVISAPANAGLVHNVVLEPQTTTGATHIRNAKNLVLKKAGAN